MPMLGEKGVILGAQALAKGIERLAVIVDQKLNMATQGPLKRPSTYINVVGGLGLVAVPSYLKWTGTRADVAEIAGGHMFNQVWDYVEELMAPAAPAAVAAAAPAPTARYAVETPGGAPEVSPPLYGQPVSSAPVLKNHVRYVVTG